MSVHLRDGSDMAHRITSKVLDVAVPVLSIVLSTIIRWYNALCFRIGTRIHNGTEVKLSDDGYPVLLVTGWSGFIQNELFGLQYWAAFSPLTGTKRTILHAEMPAFGKVEERALWLYYYMKGGTVPIEGGPTFKGAYPQWDADHPVHAIGHSIGAPTIYQIEKLIRANEVPGVSLKKDKKRNKWFATITAISAPFGGIVMSDYVFPRYDTDPSRNKWYFFPLRWFGQVWLKWIVFYISFSHQFPIMLQIFNPRCCHKEALERPLFPLISKAEVIPFYDKYFYYSESFVRQQYFPYTLNPNILYTNLVTDCTVPYPWPLSAYRFPLYSTWFVEFVLAFVAGFDKDQKYRFNDGFVGIAQQLAIYPPKQLAHRMPSTTSHRSELTLRALIDPSIPRRLGHLYFIHVESDHASTLNDVVTYIFKQSSSLNANAALDNFISTFPMLSLQRVPVN